MSAGKKQKNLLLTIFVTTLIDMLGVGVIFPVIPVLFFGTESIFFDASFSEEKISILYGLLIGIFPAMQFFGAPLLGALSDKYGRRPMLVISLIGALAGYLLFAFAINIQNIYLLFFSRMLPGFMGGNIAILYSTISDVSKEEEKAKNFGLVGAAFGLGFIIGPALGGFLADDAIVSWFDATTPFLFTAFLTAINLVLVLTIFPETLVEKRNSKVSLLTGFRNIGKSFGSQQLRTVFSVVLLLSLGFTFFTQFFSVFLIQKFNYTESDIGLLYGWSGIWIVVAQGFIIRKLKISSQKAFFYSIPILALSVVFLLVPDQNMWFYVLNALIALSYGIASPNLINIVSQQAASDRQGEILGIQQSMNSVGMFIPPIIGGYINTLNQNLPLLFSGLLILVSWLVYVIFLRKRLT